MKNYLQYSKQIKKEAIDLLSKYNLIETISKYGKIHFTGSYELDLMYKKDIDISLVNDELTVEDFTQLGKELIDTLKTPSVYYRNTRVAPVEKRPENALYWGIKTGDWWIDLWAMSEEVFLRSDNYITDIKNILTDENKTTILTLKDHYITENKYGENFSSKELYDGVLNHNVTSVNEFEEYLEKSAHLIIYK